MKAIVPSLLLKFAFSADAFVSGAVALLQLGLGSWLGQLLQLPSALLGGSGIFLVGYTTLLIVLARSRTIWRALVQSVALGNVGWAAGCVALMLEGWVQPTSLGLAFLAVQALTVLVFAVLQWRGLAASIPAGTTRPAHA